MCRPRSRGRRTGGMQCAGGGGRWRIPRSRDKARGGAPTAPPPPPTLAAAARQAAVEELGGLKEVNAHLKKNTTKAKQLTKHCET